ncbi:MAG: type II toxin-antitoxin system VapC family toxin [Bryobacteraceae bacterium]|jgi:predicted nucleic acid-binding protein
MALILDTNALSAFADGDPDLRRMIAYETDFAIPSIVLGEYLFGVRESRHKSRYESWLRTNASVFLMLAVQPSTAAHYAEIRSELKAVGRPIPTNDLWIAALAREHRSPLVTRDKHFGAVRGLQVLGW